MYVTRYMIKCAHIIAAIVLVTLVAACGAKKEVKQVSKESTISQEAFGVAEAIRSAYVKKEFSKIGDQATREGYKEVMDSIKYFDSVDLTFTPRWVEIEQTKVTLNLSWKGIWNVGKETFSERGMAILLFEGSPLRLAKIVRGNPFKYPERP